MTPGPAEPILIECEGSGCPVHSIRFGYGLCSMCGHPVAADENGATGHTRDDIIAMLKRGDYSPTRKTVS